MAEQSIVTGTLLQPPPERGFEAALLEYLEPYRQAVLDCPMLKECKAGTLSLPQIRSWVAQQYHYVAGFPTWLGLLLRRVDDMQCRIALIKNIAEERSHPALWLQLTRGWGLSDDEVFRTELCPEMQALNDYLHLVALEDGPAEGAAALCVALEGMSSAIIAEVGGSLFEHYHGRGGVVLDSFATAWMKVHSEVDPMHGHEGAVLVERYARTPEIQQRVRFTARRALEFLELGFAGVYRRTARNPA
jgi:pyrroloquinoline quinone (PQQ) biosynthesis protein C